MNGLYRTMVACGLISGTQPITLMGMLVLLGGQHGRRNASWYIFGGFCIQTTIVLISGYLLDGTVKPDSAPGHSLIALRIVAGLVLVGMGIWFRKPARKEPPEVPKILDRLGDLSPFGSFVAGVAIADYTGSAMAAAALSTNDVSSTQAVTCWAIYASLATGLLVLALVAITRSAKAEDGLRRSIAWVMSNRRSLISWICVVGGLALAGDGLTSYLAAS